MARWPIPPARSRSRSSARFADLGLPALPEAEVRELIGRGVASLVERALQRRGASADVGVGDRALRGAYAQTVGTDGDALSGRRARPRAARRRAACRSASSPTSRAPSPCACSSGSAVAPRFAAVVAGDDGWPKKPAADMLVAACAQHGSRARGDADARRLGQRRARRARRGLPGVVRALRLQRRPAGRDRWAATGSSPTSARRPTGARRRLNPVDGRAARVREKRVRGGADFRYLRGSIFSSPGEFHP